MIDLTPILRSPLHPEDCCSVLYSKLAGLDAAGGCLSPINKRHATIACHVVPEGRWTGR